MKTAGRSAGSRDFLSVHEQHSRLFGSLYADIQFHAGNACIALGEGIACLHLSHDVSVSPVVLLDNLHGSRQDQPDLPGFVTGKQQKLSPAILADLCGKAREHLLKFVPANAMKQRR